MPIAFGLGAPPEWIIIFAVALIVFGPKKLPEVGRQLGQAMKEFRKIADELTGAVHSVRDEVTSVATTARTDVESAYRGADRSPAIDQRDLMAPAFPETKSADRPIALKLSTAPISDAARDPQSEEHS
ncbi:Sec-independent protein translocase subunit TatA/TatB [Capsulimonas corticalis]|nr:twin-arginine translocase TatA/TatE family subunit [Capsulimonas corticalis]